MLGVAAGVLGVGLGTSKTVAAHERKAFKQRLTDLMENDHSNDPEKMTTRRSVEGLIDNWMHLLQENKTDA